MDELSLLFVIIKWSLLFFLTDESPQTFCIFQRDTVIRSGNTLRSDQVTPNKSNPKVYQVSTFHIPEGTWSWLGSMFGLHRLSTWCWILHSTDEMLQWTWAGPSFSCHGIIMNLVQLLDIFMTLSDLETENQLTASKGLLEASMNRRWNMETESAAAFS